MKDKENTLTMDMYQLTMSYAYFKEHRLDEKFYFDMFFRSLPEGYGYRVLGGLDKLIKTVKEFQFTEEDIQVLRDHHLFDESFLTYLKNFKFQGDIYAIKDGTPVFPNTPLVTVIGNPIEAQLLETKLLLCINHGTLITTVSRRNVEEAKGRPIFEFGTRRAHGESAAVEGAKFAYIGGVAGTACVEAEKQYGIPAVGTMAHSYIQSHDTEEEAFRSYAKNFPENSIFLVDTYDTLKSGIPNAIKVAKEVLEPQGHRLKGIRIDSGDLTELTKQSRQMLNEANMEDCNITVSNSLDEYLIRDLIAQGAEIDSFGIGENLITCKKHPVMGGVYKLVAVENKKGYQPKIKISENVEKITNPGYKKVYRLFDQNTEEAIGDIVELANQPINKEKYVITDSAQDLGMKTVTNYKIEELQVPIFKNGKLVYEEPTLEETRQYCEEQMQHLSKATKRIYNPQTYPVTIGKTLLNLKKELLLSHQKEPQCSPKILIKHKKE